MKEKINSTEVRIKKLHGKYLNDKINPEELKEFISISMSNRGNVSLKEFYNRFRNHKATAPAETTEQNMDNVKGEVYDAFTN
jgi:hypothetical protein